MHKSVHMVGVVRSALVLGASLGLWLSLLGCAGVRPARRRNCWRSARRMMPSWRSRRASSGSGFWRT
jgi:hypothetical protein